MKTFLFLFGFAVALLTGCGGASPEASVVSASEQPQPQRVEEVTPADAAKRVAEGRAFLVDVREPSEWYESGVAGPAYLLPMSDLQRNREEWGEFLEKVGERELLLYCRSGNRAGMVGEILAAEGYKVGNVGGFRDWQAAGLPERKAEEPRK